MSATLDRVPPHLRPFVVEQDYAAYDEIDQAVWRFILLQTYARLSKTAHPAYENGLRATGIDVERIPRIQDMDACLAEFGWGAVAVDGFIPPRAFQEFQALGIMTIAAGIRSSDHLAYTPAPDIVHESAGHAPIVPDPTYRDYLMRFGDVGRKAFSCPADRDVYEAVYRLSEIKEDPGASPEAVVAAGRALREAEAAVETESEAARMSRLHWWTVEYGLVGTPERYRLYGAGLLSSLGESHFCHEPDVAKLPLDRSCCDRAYDITRPQPQLYVAEDFAQLGALLDEVAVDLAQNAGGATAVARALKSGELATVELSSGLQIIGVLANARGGSELREYLQFSGPCALASANRIWPAHGRAAHAEGYGTPLGRLSDGTALSQRSESDLARFEIEGGRHRLEYRSGVVVTGRLERAESDSAGRLLLLSFEDCRVVCAGDLLFDPSWGVYDMAVAEDVRAAFAGPADPSYWQRGEFPDTRRPIASPRAGEDASMLALYREALQLWERPQAPDLVDRFEAIDESLRAFPNRWLLRWNLLECLCKVGRGGALAQILREELLATERTRPDELPISMGLRFLAGRVPPAG